MGRIYLGKLPRHTRERDIERFFHGFGRIKEIALKQGYAFVVGILENLTSLSWNLLARLSWTSN